MRVRKNNGTVLNYNSCRVQSYAFHVVDTALFAGISSNLVVSVLEYTVSREKQQACHVKQQKHVFV